MQPAAASDEPCQQGAEIIEADLLNPAAVQAMAGTLGSICAIPITYVLALCTARARDRKGASNNGCCQSPDPGLSSNYGAFVLAILFGAISIA